jgi:T-complex protein 1 subunit delta
VLASAELVEEVSTGAAKVVKVGCPYVMSLLSIPNVLPHLILCVFFLQITGIANPGKTVSILVRGSNKLVLEEAERSLHDSLCVVRCLVKNR